MILCLYSIIGNLGEVGLYQVISRAQGFRASGIRVFCMGCEVHRLLILGNRFSQEQRMMVLVGLGFWWLGRFEQKRVRYGVSVQTNPILTSRCWMGLELRVLFKPLQVCITPLY